MERFFQALGDKTRLRLLNLMGEQEICVCYFVEILAQGQPKISRHLAYLRRAGIVVARREGKWMHYRIAMPQNAGAALVLRQTLGWLKEDPAMQADRARLAKACCSLTSLLRCRARRCLFPLSSRMHLRLSRHVHQAVHARPGLRTAAAQEAVVSRPVPDAVDFSGDGHWRGVGHFVPGSAGS